MKTNYDKDFYKQIVAGSRKSADIVVPMICDYLKPESVLEIGCGMATWSASFLEHGVMDIMSVDGPWVDPKSLQIDSKFFHPHDLRNTFDAGRRFDVAVCMEVAEHLPESMARNIVSALARHADTVVFAAAIPFQGGTDHVNEQPQSYWAALFAEHNMGWHDAVRPKIWDNRNVELWYRQNTLIYSSKKLDLPVESILDVVHPEMIAYYLSDWKGILRAGKRLATSKS